MTETQDTTQLLAAYRSGDRAAYDRLFSRLYDELRRLAHRRLRRSAAGETIRTTALVHEAYVRLVEPGGAAPADRVQFLALAARAMRFVLVDAARARSAKKRGGDRTGVPLEAVQLAAPEPHGDLLALDAALTRLQAVSERQSKLVELRFFGGMSYDEIAEATGLSIRTVKRDWERARLWLFTYLENGTPAQ
jgi:RNA polymerase sigma factor (TIGR02999 family)